MEHVTDGNSGVHKKQLGRYWASVLEKKTAKLIGRVIEKKSVALSITVSKKFHVEECILKGCVGWGGGRRDHRDEDPRGASREGDYFNVQILQERGLGNEWLDCDAEGLDGPWRDT